LKARLFILAALVAGLFGALALASAPAALAHPLGNFTINRYAGLVLSPRQVDVTYVVDMAEIPTFQESPAIDANGDGTLDDAERSAWADRESRLILRNLTLDLGGKPIDLSVVTDAVRFRSGQAGLPILYFTSTFRGSLDSTAGTLRYSDGNFPGRIGWKEVTATSEKGVALTGSDVPTTSISRDLRAYPKDLLASPLDVTNANLSFGPGQETRSDDLVRSPTVSGAPVASGGAFAALVGRPLTPLVLALSLTLAFGFGAVHALGPGHGKTITAAYLVGQEARARQAAVVGAAVALMHTASVLALGLVVFVMARSFPADRVYPWLTLGTGVVALALGAALLASRVRARQAGVEAWHGHAHPHGPGHSHPEHPGQPGRTLTGRGLVALAVAGGILPSPTAFVVLTGAVAAHRVGYGLALILAFSVGLAASLMVVGVLALRARAAVSRSLAGRGMTLIPIASALVIVGFGLFFATKGLTQLA
jgi:ABC-type nickel/cobalt efflux system permease component RcnA